MGYYVKNFAIWITIWLVFVRSFITQTRFRHGNRLLKSSIRLNAASSKRPVKKPATKTKPASPKGKSTTKKTLSTAKLTKEAKASLDSSVLKKVKEIERGSENTEQKEVDEAVAVTGSGKWSPIKTTAASTGFRDIDEEEDTYIDPFFMPQSQGKTEEEFFGAGGTSSNKNQGEWDDWNEDANYFDDDVDDNQNSRVQSVDKSKEVGGSGSSSSLFLTRSDYAKIANEKEGLSLDPVAMAQASPANSPINQTRSEACIAIDSQEPEALDTTMEVIPPETLRSLIKLEAKVEKLSSDLIELKIVNAGLLGVLALTIYSLTRPIW